MDNSNLVIKNNNSANQTKLEVNNSTGLPFQFILMIITLTITGFLFYKPLFRFNCNDARPRVKSLNKDISIITQKPTPVKVGLFIHDFPEFDVLNDNFVFDGIIFFEFDPTVFNLENITKFSFKNGNFLYKSEPQVKLNKDLAFARYNIKVKIKSGLNYKLFPFASHRLNIILDNNFLYIEEISFKAAISKFIINKDTNISGWKEYNKEVISGYYSAQFQKFKSQDTVRHPRVGFIIEYLNNSTKELLSIFLPLFLLFFMSIFSLGLNPIIYFHQILSLTSGSLTGALSYRYIINNMSPKVEYFMLSDIVYFVFLGLIIFIFLCSCQIYSLSKKTIIVLSILCNLTIILTFFYVFKIWSNLG